MRQYQIRLRSVVAMVRRRWLIPVVALALTGVVGTIGAYLAPRKYESSTTILVRPDRTLNPVAGYELMYAFEEQLRNFDQIIYSRTLLVALADSLGLLPPSGRSEAMLEGAVRAVRSGLSTQRLGSDSFRITFEDSDPLKARKGAEVASALFIKTKIAFQTQEHNLTVQFYEGKVEEYSQDLQMTVRTMLATMNEGVSEAPVQNRSLYAQLENVDGQIRQMQSEAENLQRVQRTLKDLPERLEAEQERFGRPETKQLLHDLASQKIAFAPALQELMNRYDDVSRRYQADYPEIARVESDIVEMLRRMRLGNASEINRVWDRIAALDGQRTSIVVELKRSSVVQQETQQKESSFEIKKKLYDDMKVKLEQARLAREVSERGASQFVILDPPTVPALPTKPNRGLIILSSIGLGFVLGVVLAILAELFDTTIRVSSDIEVYGKPVIALLPPSKHPAVKIDIRQAGQL